MKLLTPLMLSASLVLVACGSDEGTATSETQQTAQSKPRDCTLTFGWESRQPYQFSMNDTMQGIDVEIFQQAANSIDCDVAFVEQTWSELLTGVEKGEIDVLGGATVTPEREAYAEFSDNYRSESFALFILSDDSFQGDELQAFLSNNNKVGIVAGYYYGDMVANLMDHPQYGEMFIDERSTEQSLYNMFYSRTDGALADPVEGKYVLKRKGLGNKIKQSAVSIPSSDVAFMMSKTGINETNRQRLKAAIAQLVAQNKIDPIIARYQ